MLPTKHLWLPTQHDLDAVLSWSREQGLAFFAKRPSPLMQASAITLSAVRVMPRDVFLDQYTTVLRHRAYAPWVGQATRHGEERWARIQTVVHEVQHWLQWQREPGLRFATWYLASQQQRALWEAEAYSCNVELAAWRGEALPDPARIAERLKEYGCSEPARELARRVLETTLDEARAGRFHTTAVLRVLPLLETLRNAARESS